MVRMIAIDLDGTLLNSYGEISEENRKAIDRAKENGIEIVLTSGRIASSVEQIAKDVGADHYLISGNGALAFNMQKDEKVYDNYISKKKILDIIDVCEKNSIYYNIYTENSVIAKSLKYNVLFYYNENHKKSSNKKININITQNIKKYVEELKNDNFLKVTICDQDRIVFTRIMEKLKKIKDIDVLEISHMSRKEIVSGTQSVSVEYFYTEITNKNVNKWAAIEAIMAEEGITKEEVVAIGDNMNDKEMIQNAGCGIAMGNSHPIIKKMADLVVNDNNASGVAEAIEQIQNVILH